MKKTLAILVTFMICSVGMISFIQNVKAFEKEVNDFDRIWYDNTIGWNKAGVGTLVLAITYTNATADNPNFREIDYCGIDFQNDPFSLEISFEEENTIEYDYEGNIVYEEPSDGYFYLRKSFADNYLPDSIKELASKSQSLTTITFQSIDWYRVYCPDFNRDYSWKKFEEPVEKEKWFTWGSTKSIQFISRAMYIYGVEIREESILLDISHDFTSDGQSIAINKTWLKNKNINVPIFELEGMKNINFVENETHYMIYPEHFSIIGIHNASTGYTLGRVTADNVPREITDMTTFPNGLRFSYDDKWLAVSNSSTLIIYNTTDWSINATLTDATDAINCIAWSHDSNKIAAGSDDNKYYVWNVSDWSEWSNDTDMGNDVDAVNFNHNDTCVYVGVPGMGASVYSTTDNIYVNAMADDVKTQEIAVASDGSHVAIPEQSTTIRIYNQTTYNLVDSITGIDSAIHGLRYSPNSRYLAVANSKDVDVYDRDDSYNLAKEIVPYGDNQVYGISWHSESDYISCSDASGSGDDYAYIFTWDNGYALEAYRMDDSNNRIFYTDWNHNGRLFAYTGWEKKVYINQMMNVTRTTGSYTEQNNVTFNPDINFTDNVTLVIPVSDGVTGITQVYNWELGEAATEVNNSGELVNNSYWFDSANQLVHIRTMNRTTSDIVNWSVNCSSGATFDISFPDYLEIGDYIIAYGRITDSSGNGINGILTETHLYQGGVDAVDPVYWNCSNGNFQATMYTTSLEPGIYSISVEYEDVGSGLTIKEGNTLYLSTNVPVGSGIHVLSQLNFNFYDADTGEGLLPDLFKVYVSEDTTFTEDDRIYRTYYNTKTDDTLYYKIKDYFNNTIYPTASDYSTVNIVRTKQFEDIPVDWHSFSIKNMNHSIVNFTIKNGSRTYTRFIYPYEDMYWDVLPGEYNLTVKYINPVTDAEVHSYQENITINSDTYYWIAGYDLQDVIIEITAVNTSIDTLSIDITTGVNLTDSAINSINVSMSTYLSLVESNLTTLNNQIWNAINITDSVVDYINNTIWNEISSLNLTVDYINNTIWSEFTLINSNINSINSSIRSSINLFESNLTTLNNQIWNAINITDSVVDYINNTIWNEISSVNLTVDYINNTLWTELTFINSSIDYLNNTVFTNFTFINSTANTIYNHVTTMWNAQNISFGNLTNRSTVVFSFYNTNEGLGLDRETLKVYINGSRIVGDTYICYNSSDKINVTIRDYYNNTLYHNNFTITAPFTFIDLGLTFHSWLFSNKNDDYYMISIRRYGAERWWERGIVPYGEREFMIPSGNYTLRIYDKDDVEIYNSTLTGNITVNNSRVYVIHGTNLSLIINGQSVIRGQLLELSSELDTALMPDAVIWKANPVVIFSVFDRIGQNLGNDVWKVCPALNVIATTRISNYGNWYNSTATVPGNGTTENGTITILEDTIYISGNSSVDWVNITYTDNGTLYQNTTYIPGKINVFGQNFTVNASCDVYVLRETVYSQMKKFYWNIYNSTMNPGHIEGRAGFHRTGIIVDNPLNVPIYDVYVYAGFSDKTTPDESTARVNDVENGILLERGEDFKTTDGIEFKIEGGIAANSEREFTLSYYKDTAHTYYYEDAQDVIYNYEEKKTLSGYDNFFNMAELMWVNDNQLAFRGSLKIKLDLNIEVDASSVKVFDMDNNEEVDEDDIIVGNEFVWIGSDTMGNVQSGGTRTFKIYFREKLYPGQSVDEYHLSTPFVEISGIPISAFVILLIISVLVGLAGAISIIKTGKMKDKYLFMVLLGVGLTFVFWILQAKGV